MHYIIYKITNKITGKYYIGAHKTKNLNDGYMGSGTLIKKAIQKYGIDSFHKEILKECSSIEEMFNTESIYIGNTYKTNQTYNMAPGGTGQSILENRKVLKEKMKDPIFKEAWVKNIRNSHSSEQYKIKAKKNLESFYLKNGYGTFAGKHHTNESKKKIGKINSIKQAGNKNSQFGTFWITNGKENKKCKDNIPKGWYKGRKI